MELTAVKKIIQQFYLAGEKKKKKVKFKFSCEILQEFCADKNSQLILLRRTLRLE